METPKSRIPMFGKAKIQNFIVWKSQNSQFQCLEKKKSRIPIFGSAKIPTSSVWKSHNSLFQCLEKAKMENSNVWNN